MERGERYPMDSVGGPASRRALHIQKLHAERGKPISLEDAKQKARERAQIIRQEGNINRGIRERREAGQNLNPRQN